MKIFPVFIPHAGCPGGCIYCDQSLNSDVASPPSPEEVVRMLQQGVPAAGLDQVAFYGGSFTALPDELQVSYLQTVQPFIKSRQISGVRISTRPDRLTAKSVRLLRDYGVETVELGCQSFSDDVLLASGRGCRAENHAVAVRLLRSAGFSVGIQLMPGLPGGGVWRRVILCGRRWPCGLTFSGSIRLWFSPGRVWKSTGGMAGIGRSAWQRRSISVP